MHQKNSNKVLTRETQARLYGKTFYDDDPSSNNSNYTLGLRSDIIENRHEVDVMYTLHMHHEDFEYDMDLEKKMEKGVMTR
jgi:hypothetical protein